MSTTTGMRGWTIAVAGALALAAATGTHAAIRVEAARVTSGGVRVADASLTLTPQADGRTALVLRLGRAQLDGWTAPYTNLRYGCTLARDDAAAWACEGALRATRAGNVLSGRLALMQQADGAWRAGLRAGEASATIAQAAAADTMDVQAKAMPVDWLADVLAALLPGYRAGGGSADLGLQVTTTDDGWRTTGTWQLAALGLDSPDGEIGTADLHASGTITATARGKDLSIELDATLARGSWLVAPLFAEIGAQPVTAALAIASTAEGWRIERWQWRDPDALEARGSAALAADGSVRAVIVEQATLQFPAAFARYLQSLAAPLGLPGLSLAGTATATVNWRPDAPLRGEVTAKLTAVDDPGGRFAAHDVDVALNLGGGDAAASHIAWRDAALFGIPVAAARAELALADGGARLREPLRLPMLGGSVTLERFARTPAGDGAHVDAALRMDKLNLAELARAFGWPEFGGTLSGTIPAVRGTGDRYAVDGTLRLNVFDGEIAVGGLAMERPFGVAPSLTADVAMTDLDLLLLTQAFSFGSIEGRLDGKVQGLRLLDWSPVAFDATLRTDEKRAQKQRISQRAVNSLSSVGGGAAGIQASLLRIFEHFSYDAIGLDLSLRNNVVTMGGLDEANGGYTIVRGAGVPRLSVVGYQRRVDWPVLLSRLRAATQGQAPIIGGSGERPDASR